MSDSPRPRLYLDLTLTPLVPGDQTTAMEAVRQQFPPAPAVKPGFIRHERAEIEICEAADEELTARNRKRDELLTAAAQIKVEGAGVTKQYNALLVEPFTANWTSAEHKLVTAVCAAVLRAWAALGYVAGIRPTNESGELP